MADEDTQDQPNADGSGNAGDTEKRFTQADLNRAIDARLARERAAAEKTTKEREEAAEAERKRQQGEFESLATSAQARVKELEAHKTQHESVVEAYDKALTTRIRAETKDWPDEARAALPKDADALALAEAVERLRPLALKLAGAGKTPGTAMGPRAAAPNRDEQGAREQQALRARGFGARM